MSSIHAFAGLQLSIRPPMNLSRASDILRQNFDLMDTAAGRGGKDGLVGTADLQAILHNPAASTDLKEAAEFLLSNPAHRNQLDVAAGHGGVDGLIGRKDIDAFQGSAAYQPNQPEAGIDFGHDPLLAVGGGFDPGLQELFGVNRGIMNTGAARVRAVAQPDDGMSVRDAASVLKKHWNKVGKGKGKVANKQRLKDIVASDWAPPELKAACNKILSTPGAYQKIFHAHKSGNKPFSKGISAGDLNTVTSPGNTALGPRQVGPVSRAGQNANLKSAAAVLRDNWKQVGTGKDKTASKQRLKDIVASDSASPQLKAACNTILNTPGGYDRLFNAHRSGNRPFSRGISKGDVNTFTSPGWND